MATFRNRYFTNISNSPGTSGDFVISSALQSYQTFEAGDDGLIFDVVIREGNNWEIRTDCTYTHGTTTLSRGTLSDSSSGVAVNFSNAATIFVTIVAEKLADDTKVVHLAGTEVITGNKTFSGTLDAVTPALGTDDTTVPTTEWVNNTISNPNIIINGRFDFWQRGTSLAAVAGTRYLADRWQCGSVGSTNAPSRQSFTVGQSDVPGNPVYYHRYVVSSVAGAANYAVLVYKVEDVTLLAGKTVTLSFWKKADASKNMAVEFIHFFGTGGSPSSTVTALGVTTCALTTSWQKFTVTTILPSVSGKTLGTDNNDYLQIRLWMDGGSNWNTNNNTLGQQSGTFDVAMVKLEEGSVATEYPVIDFEQELARCQRYFYRATQPALRGVMNATTNASRLGMIHPVTMRAAPTLTMPNALPIWDGSVISTLSSITYNYSTTEYIECDGTTAEALNVGRPAIIYQGGWSYLDVDAEL